MSDLQDATPVPAPMALATWEPVTAWEYDQQTWMALDRRLCCIISTSAEPSPVGDRGTFIVTFPRPDGLFEHLYGPGPRVIEAIRALREGQSNG